jgi:hypothetical protein
LQKRRLRGRRCTFTKLLRPLFSAGAGFMIVLLSLLLIAFIFGIWMGLCFYRRITVKVSADAIAPRYPKSRTHTYQG